jgi:hypothetical protein
MVGFFLFTGRRRFMQRLLRRSRVRSVALLNILTATLTYNS